MNNSFIPESLQGFDAARFNQQQYKAAHLQRWIESGEIKSNSELLKSASAIEASFSVFAMVHHWASENGYLIGGTQ